jgi:hypothetical protein
MECRALMPESFGQAVSGFSSLKGKNRRGLTLIDADKANLEPQRTEGHRGLRAMPAE